MASHDDTNKRTASTTRGGGPARIAPAPQAEGTAGRRPSSRRGEAPRNSRKPLTVTIVYRGGSEAWWELRARGLVIRRPGHVMLHEVLQALQE